jgi:hypothetical protein
MNFKGILEKIKTTPKLIDWKFGVYQLLPLHKYGEKSKALTTELSGRADVPDLPDMPIHLRDYLPTFRTTKSGGNIAGIGTPEDFEGMAPSPALIVLYYALALFLPFFFIGLIRGIGVTDFGAIGVLPKLIASIASNDLSSGLNSGMLAAMIGVAVCGTLGSTGFIVFVVSIIAGTLSSSPRSAIRLATVGVSLMAIGFLPFLIALVPNGNYLLYPLYFLLLVAPKVKFVRSERERTTKLVFQSRKHTGGAAILKNERPEDRLKQAKQAIAEKDMPHVLFGELLGVLAQTIISPWVGDPGLPLRASIPTMSLHTHVFGSSGAGKTTLLRGLISQLYKTRGMLALDFKAALPYDIRKALHVRITTSDDCNMLHGVSPGEFNNFMRSIHRVENSPNAIFLDNGLKISLFSHTLLKEATDMASKGSDVVQPISLIDQHKESKKYYNNIGGLSRLVEALADMDRRKVYLDRFANYFDFQLSEEKKKGIGPITEALTYLRNLDAMDAELVSSFFSNAATIFFDFFENDYLKPWAESTKAPIDFLDCFTNFKRIGISIGDMQGATGVLYLKMFNKRFKKLAKQLSVDVLEGRRKAEDINSVLYVVDECGSLFEFDQADGLGDDQMVSIYRSLKVECIFACQSMSQLMGRFGKDKTNAFFTNIRTVISYLTNEDETYELMASRVDVRPRITRNIPNCSVIDFAETYNNKANNPIYDERNPNREPMLGLHGAFGVKAGYEHGKLDITDFPIISNGIEIKGNEKALDRATYTKWIQSPRVAFASVYVSGGYRQDFIKPYAVDEDFQPYDLSSNATDENLEVIRQFDIAEKARELYLKGDTRGAARAAAAEEFI